ncbi:MAG TPA: hypothetical protein ENK64_00960 [Flavobacteriales bacterium]|nr:hypothetical protein [Flavobacteriales bacterium]
MKVLMIYCDLFAYKPQIKTLPEFPDFDQEENFDNVLVGFIQMEAKDESDLKYFETKLVKSLKWAAKKNNTNKIILHSFAHLSESKASPEQTKNLFDQVEIRLQNVNYDTHQTPFGYFLDINVKAPGKSSARIFKSFELK